MSHADSFTALQARKDLERQQAAAAKRQRGAAQAARRKSRDKADLTPAEAAQAIRQYAGQQISRDLERSICKALNVTVPQRDPHLPVPMASVAGRVGIELALGVAHRPKTGNVRGSDRQKVLCELIADKLDARR